MKKLTLRIAAAVLLLGSSGLLSAAQNKGKADQKKLQGTWIAKKGKFTAKMILKGSKFTFTMSDGEKTGIAKGTYKIDAGKKPNTIDMKISKGKGEEMEKYVGKTSLGIFALDGNRLMWCASEPGDTNRPTKFSRDGQDVLLLSFQRKKAKD